MHIPMAVCLTESNTCSNLLLRFQVVPGHELWRTASFPTTFTDVCHFAIDSHWIKKCHLLEGRPGILKVCNVHWNNYGDWSLCPQYNVIIMVGSKVRGHVMLVAWRNFYAFFGAEAHADEILWGVLEPWAWGVGFHTYVSTTRKDVSIIGLPHSCGCE